MAWSCCCLTERPAAGSSHLAVVDVYSVTDHEPLGDLRASRGASIACLYNKSQLFKVFFSYKILLFCDCLKCLLGERVLGGPCHR